MVNLKSFLVVSLLISSTFAYASEEGCIAATTNITKKIECLSEVTITNTATDNDGNLVFDMVINQLMDHKDPTSQQFQQRIVLTHLNTKEPMLLQTSGYSIFRVRLAHIARVFGTNQLQIEHRYFEKSIPSNPDWSFLNIKQSADDFHKITETFKKIYAKPWINTGASKGGMTSTYHRYFYPNDLVGTVADVAPLSFSTSDQRYNKFLDNVGGDKYKSCRESIKTMQQILLKNRDQFLPSIEGTYTQLGGKEVAYEHSVLEAHFYFWQYGNPETCNNLPALNDTQAVYDFFQKLAEVTGYADSDLQRFVAYFYQSATELGGPDNISYHLEELRQFEFSVSQYTPHGVEIPYSNTSMRAIQEWALNDADEIMYVYGEFDPWTAAEYPIGVNGKNTYKFSVPAGNHSANFTKLQAKDKAKAIKIISQWLGKDPVSTKNVKSFTPSLDQLEYNIRKSLRL